MPYYRTRKNRFRRNKYRYRRGRKSTASTARAAYAISKRTQYLTKPESKFYEDFGGSLVEDGNATYVLMNPLVQGTDVENRIGRIVSLKAMELRLRFVINNAATASAVRCILVYDKQPNGAAFPLGSLLAPGPTIPFDGVRNLDYRDRFIVLRDWTVSLSINGDRIKNIHKYVKMALKPVYDNSNTGTISDIQTGALYFVMVSNEGTNFPAVTYSLRVRFYDA